MLPGNSFKRGRETAALKKPKSSSYLYCLLLLDAAASLTAIFGVVAPLLLLLGIDAKERLCGLVQRSIKETFGELTTILSTAQPFTFCVLGN